MRNSLFSKVLRFCSKRFTKTQGPTASESDEERTCNGYFVGAEMASKKSSSFSTVFSSGPCDTLAQALDGAYLVASSLPPPHPNSSPSLVPQEVYTGGYTNPVSRVRLRVASGGAGQSGLIAAWANAFIQYMVEVERFEPFMIEWYLGDTTDSLGFLQSGSVDVAVTYNEAAEKQSMDSGAATRRVYGFRDHFLLVGPKSNPAGLDPGHDDILTMFNKIVASGNADQVHPPDPSVKPPTRFLSRFDKSATNIKESELFIKIGQVPWALAYSRWYHQYPRFPRQALEAAALLSEYTLTDRSTILSSPQRVMELLEVFKAGGDDDPCDPLLNPGHVVLGSKATPEDVEIGERFLDWVCEGSGGRKVLREMRKNGEVLYSEAPV